DHGLQASRRRRLRFHRRGHDLDRGGLNDRLAREISSSQSGDSRIQLELATVGLGESRNISRALPAYGRENRRSARSLLQELLHRFRERRRDDLPSLGFV